MTGKGKDVWDITQIAQKFSQGREKETLFRGSFLNMLLIHITPETEIPAHYEDYDAFFYILEGTGIILIGDERIPVKPNMIIFSPKSKLRGIFPKTALLILGIQETH